MIPTKTIEELIIKHSTLEKDLSSGNLDNKAFAENNISIPFPHRHVIVHKADES